jgi:hypothetical protein
MKNESCRAARHVVNFGSTPPAFVFISSPSPRSSFACEAFGDLKVATPMLVAEAVSRVAKVRAAWGKQEGSS